MAAEWSSENFVAEFKDLQANVMALDCLGSWALLAGKKVYAFVNLDNPEEGENSPNVVRVARQSKWDTCCVQFNPHASHAQLYVTACNQRLDIYSMEDKNRNARCSLKAHSWIISDVDWSPFDVNVVASCSVDSFTYLWDIRDSKKPVSTFQTVAGVYQVKWNKVKNNLFATTHEGDVRIWDPRKGNTPLQYISAHFSKIYGLDWSPNSDIHLVTASQDCYVRIWDYTNPKNCEGSINSGAPVWRARYTPFGTGLMTVVVPQLRRGENSLYLWNMDAQNQVQPIHTFVGHKDVVLEFQWRRQLDGVRDYQLVTWSRDQSLRIWRIEPRLQRLCGHDTGEGAEVDVTGTSYNSSESTIKDLRELSQSESGLLEEELGTTATTVMAQQPYSLQQEFNVLSKNLPNITKNLPNITIDELDAADRICRVTWKCGAESANLELSFPATYPNNAAPSLKFLSTTMDSNIQRKLIKMLNETSQRLVRRNNNCLESCLRQIVSELDSILDERRSPDAETVYPRSQQQPIVQPSPYLPLYNFGNFQDSSVPFPRTSGARFCSNGLLVLFGVPAEMKKVSGGTEITPKALADLAVFAQTPWKASSTISAFSAIFSRSPPTPSSDLPSISDFFILKDKHKPRSGRHRRHEQVDKSTKKQLSVGKVKIYDAVSLLGVSRYLAQNYRLDMNDIEGTCRHNASVAASIGRKDLVQVWNMVSVMSSKGLSPGPNPDSGTPWAMLPLGRRLLQNILDRYTEQHDVQTLAMLCCVFWTPEPGPKVERTASKTSVEYVPSDMDANISYYQPGSSTDSGWSLLQSTVGPPSSNLPSGALAPTWSSTHGPPVHPGTGHMCEVASQPNLAALFKAAVAKSKRSLSWSESYDDFKIYDIKNPQERAAEQERLQHEDSCKMLDPALWEQHEQFKLAYACILYNWRLLEQRTQILQFTSTPAFQHKGLEFAVYCHKCRQEIRGPQCSSCKHPALQCAICHLGVLGAANFCLTCGHGGHTAHMMEWFMKKGVCPTGCGCDCLRENMFGGL